MAVMLLSQASALESQGDGEVLRLLERNRPIPQHSENEHSSLFALCRLAMQGSNHMSTVLFQD